MVEEKLRIAGMEFGKKSIITEGGVLELEVPRDRNAEFAPLLVPKRQTRIDGLDQKILSLYAKGMRVSDIKMQIQELYVALGIDLTGRKDILGLWISENEGAKFWLNNFTEMKNRGLKDILIACSDNLTGMGEAISAVYPETEHQLCIVHQIRNSLA